MWNFVQFLVNAVLDAKEVVKEIQSSLSDQKQLIDLHVRRQEEVVVIICNTGFWWSWEFINKFCQVCNLILEKKIQGLQHSLVSAQKISNASMNIFNELHSHASKVMTLLEESQIERSNQLVNFEKTFKVAKRQISNWSFS